MNHLWYVLALGGLLSGGCSQNYSKEEAPAALAQKGLKPVPSQTGGSQTVPPDHPPIGSAAEAAGQATDLGGVLVVPPAGWVAAPPSSSMRVAEYRLDGQAVGGGEASLAVFHFGPNQGGSVEANIDRWYGQFTQADGRSTRQLARRWQRTVAGIPVELVYISGNFSGGMGAGGALEDAAMLGAIASAPAGLFFFKMLGPRAVVDHWEDSFEAYIGSLKPRP